MTAKQEAENRLEDIVTLADAVVARARAAQAAIAKIADAPPERKEDQQ